MECWNGERIGAGLRFGVISL